MADISLKDYNSKTADKAPTTSAYMKTLINQEKLSPTDQRQADPLSFTSLKYPRDVGSDELGHYIIFYTVSNIASIDSDMEFANSTGIDPSFEVTETGATPTQENVINVKSKLSSGSDGSFETPQYDASANNSLLSKTNTHTIRTGAITMYMPATVSVKYSMDYGAVAMGLAGQLQRTIDAAADADGILAKGKAYLSGIGGGAMTYGGKLLGDLIQAVPEAGDPVQLITQSLGLAVNPHEEQFFNKPNFRSFNYNFDFYPRNYEESKEVVRILQTFKYHMSPGLDANTGGRYFTVPSEFEIYYYWNGKSNDHLNKISRCALSDLSVSYGQGSQWSAFDVDADFTMGDRFIKGAPPTHIKADLTFVELSFITKQNIARGY